MKTARTRLGLILIRQGAISPEELESGMLYQVRTEAMGAGDGASHGFRLGEALVSLGLCSEREVARGLAEQMEIPFVDLQEEPPTEEALGRIPLKMAAEFQALPVRISGDCLVVAAADPTDRRLHEALNQATDLPLVAIYGASPAQVREVIERLRRGVPPVEPQDGDFPVDEISGGASLEQVAAAPGEFSPPELMNSILTAAARQGASDVFFGTNPQGVEVQMRLAGEARTVLQLPREIHEPLMAHILLTCGLDPTADGRRQEGRCRVHVDGRPVRLHAATVPGPSGDGAVIRLSD